ncbi:hypothetical protein [Nocardia sp. Marseille-Q1738]
MVAFNDATGALLWVKCPSFQCFGQRVPIINGRMASHDSPMDTPYGQKCPWIGIRVVDDRAPYGYPAAGQPSNDPRLAAHRPQARQ